MRIPEKYLFYEGLPNAKDVDQIMAQGGYHSLPSVDTSNYQPIDADSVHASVGMPGDPMHLQVNRQFNGDNNPNGFGQYFNAALGAADSLIPGERIHKNYVTQPLPVYNPYQYGTGSQAIMAMGGVMDAQMYGRVGGAPMDPGQLRKKKKHGKAGDGIMLESYDIDTAKSGIHIKPENRGKFTAYKKRTGKTTEEALHSSDPHVRKMANFARNAKKWHHGENGIMLYPYDIEMADNGIMLESYDIDTAANGATVSSDKAKEILRDGTAQGHDLTKKQKRYFGWIAGGKAPNGTQLGGVPTPPPGFNPQGGNGEAATPRSRGDAYLLDEINKTLVGGTRPSNINKHYTPEEFQQLSNAYTWQQVNGNKANPKSNIQGYFNRPVNPNDKADYYRGRLNAMGQGALSMYNSSPDIDINPLPPTQPNPIQSVASTMANGGYVPGSVHDLSEEQIARLLKQGHRIEYL